MSLWSRMQRRLGDLAGELVLDEYRDQLDQAHRLVAGGDATTAIELLEVVVAAKPEHGQALIALGAARLAARDPARALAAFERALELRNGDPAALVGHGLALVALARHEAAITSLGRAVAEAAGDRAILADAYRGLGVAWRRRGDVDKAIRELRKAVAEDGEDSDARAALGEALVADGGPYEEALRHLERAAAADSPPTLALLGLGRMALIDGLHAIADDRLGRARALAERDPTPLGAQVRLDVITAQGDAALAAREASRAHGFFLEALQVEPRRADLHAKIAEAHRSIGNSDAALASYERALALGAGADTLRAAVDAAIAAGDPAREARWASDLLTLDPTDVRAIVARAASMALEQPAAARALFELAAARDDVDAHVWLARLALGRDPEAAQRSALAALRVAPRHGPARQVLTEAHAALFGAPGFAADDAAGPEVRDLAALARFLQKVVGQRRELGHLVGEIASAAANLDQPLLVTVMGEFSSGKSSFVNAFIGSDVAPTGITPTTATINVVRYGRERGGRVVSADGATLELGWDAMMAHLRALTPEAARAIDRVEILVPLPQLEKIHIVDTPGLNSIQPEHEATARGFISRADAIVWVFTASQGGKASEKRALRSIRDEGKRVLGVLNKADQLSPDETTEVVGFITGELGDLVEAIVPFSARQALAWKQSPAAARQAGPEERPLSEEVGGGGPRDVMGGGVNGPAVLVQRGPGSPLSQEGEGGGSRDAMGGGVNGPAAARQSGPEERPLSQAVGGGGSRDAMGAGVNGPAVLVLREPGSPLSEEGGGGGPRDATRGGVNGPALPVQRGRERPLLIDGSWGALEAALEERFFRQARQLKRDGCLRALRGAVGEARTAVDAIRSRASEAADAARAGRDQLLASARTFAAGGVLTERKALSEASTLLYRRAAREVLDLVRPRRLPFSSHTATAADRDYLIALLSSGFEGAIDSGRRRVAAELTQHARLGETAARTLSAALGVDVIGELHRAADDQIGLALSRVFDRARAFLRGYLEGGYVEGFFRNDVPRLELAEDAVYHALVRNAPDLDRELGEPLARAATDALTALAHRLDHWAAVVDVQAFDVEVGVGRALELAEARLA